MSVNATVQYNRLARERIARRPRSRLPQCLIDSVCIAAKQDFDQAKHVNFEQPSRIHTMDELGLGGKGISPVGISEPFPLFTEEAVQQMRAELFSERVLKDHQYASTFCEYMIRGHCPEAAPFITAAWNDPKVLDAISKVAGIDLVPAWSHETAHVNISIGKDARDDGLVSSQTSAKHNPDAEDSTEAFGWHMDSVSFVCIVMLSDCTGMVGGETRIRTGHGTCLKFRGPTMGTAVVMQGRYIPHQALEAQGGKERISMVTGLRPKSAFALDESVLTAARGMSNVPELYFQFASYRYENLEERFRDQSRRIRKDHEERRDFDLHAAQQFLLDQRDYINATLAELINIDEPDA